MINTLHLLGYLGRDPEFKQLQSGSTVANFSVPWSQRRNVNGEWVENTHWFDVDVWNENTIQRLQEKFNQGEFGKGDLIYIEGQVMKEEYPTRDGQRGSKLKLRAFNVRMIPRKRTACESCGYIPQRNQNYQNGQPQQPSPYQPQQPTGYSGVGGYTGYTGQPPQQPVYNQPQQPSPYQPQPAPVALPQQPVYNQPQQPVYNQPPQPAPVAPPQHTPVQNGDMNGMPHNPPAPHNPAPQPQQNQDEQISTNGDEFEDLPW